MSRFKKNKKRGAPATSTASLPDIVFMLLFFFMVATVMRETDMLVDIKQPEANEIVKLENRKLVAHIYIGTPVKAGLGKEPRIQLDDQLVNDATKVRQWLDIKKGKLDETEASQMVVSLKVDGKTKMGIVNRVKYELRDNLQFRINYSAATPKVAAD
jgi:biopolymer transport protein ExbD